MKILERYILSEFVKILAIALGAFVLLFIMVDVFENMDSLMGHKVPLLASIVFFAYKVPFIISQISPIAVLMAVLLSLGILSKSGEITAMKAGGVRFLRIAYPLIAFGLVMSVAVIIMNEYATPAALKKADAFKKNWFGVQGGTFGKEGMWLRTSNGIFNIRHLNTRDNIISGVTFYSIEKPFIVKARTFSRTAQWKDKKWTAPEATQWVFTPEREAVKSERKGLLFEDLPDPVSLANVENIHKNMGFLELRQYIKGLERDGYETARYRIDLYGKISFPLVNFLMVLVGIPFAVKTGRHSGIAMGVGLSIVIAFSYWVVFAITRSLGQSGVIPPLFSALFPDMIFFAVGALMLGYVRQ